MTGQNRIWWQWLAAALLGLGLGGCEGGSQAPVACQTGLEVPSPDRPRAGMVLIRGGDYAMGTAALRPEEGPARQVTVADFWIDRTEVTNAAFARFVARTGYKTLAERPLDAKAYPGLTPEQLRPSSLVFVGSDRPVTEGLTWWKIVPGADWKHPHGPGSSIRGRESQPVVHIAYADALAYARWLGRDLPTEAEWEYAARGGLKAKPYVWGGEKEPAGKPASNSWQGIFPLMDTGRDGHKAATAPVGCYAPNGYGLFDMAGNVWEWTKDWYKPGLETGAMLEKGGPPEFASHDPDEPGIPKHVIKGGSFLCADDYCFRYRPAARSPGPTDSGTSHVGFRTVQRLP